MSYDTIQVVTQIASMAIFGGVLLVFIGYALRKSNKHMFASAAETPLRNDELPVDKTEQ